MENELLETFEAAKKAADAAADGAGSSEVDRCLDALRRLKKIPVTTKALVDTQVGKHLRPLGKHSQEKIRAVASELLQFWKNQVIEETSKNSKKADTPQEKNSMKVDVKSEQGDKTRIERMSKAVAEKSDKVMISKSVKMEKVESNQGVKIEVSKSESVKINNGGRLRGGESPSPQISKVEKQSNSRNQPSLPNGPPKLTSIVKCNNPARDKVREILSELFSRVPKETLESIRDEVKNILDEVEECDPFRVAVIVESALFEKLGPSTGSQKVKYRSILFNLKDSNNPDFRRRVLLGLVKPEDIVDMAPEEMASDERKLTNKQIKEKALFECERAGAPKATTDQFKCGRCGQRKTTYYQLQTRSADEPMTTFVTCVNCNNHWKFC